MQGKVTMTGKMNEGANTPEPANLSGMNKLFAKKKQEPQQPAPAGTDPSDPTGAGGGTIGTGIAPTPNEQGFTGNEQPQGQQANTAATQTLSGEQETAGQLQ